MQITQAQGYKWKCRHPYVTCQKVPSKNKSFWEYCKIPNMLRRACQGQQSAFKNALPLSTVLQLAMRHVAKVLTRRYPWWVASLQCSHPKCLNPGAHWKKHWPCRALQNIDWYWLLFATPAIPPQGAFWAGKSRDMPAELHLKTKHKSSSLQLSRHWYTFVKTRHCSWFERQSQKKSPLWSHCLQC